MSWFTVLRLLLYRSVLELFSKSFKVFHCSVINVRCCYFQQLVYFIISSSRCQQLFLFFLCCRSFAATLISYHVCRFLSTTFWIFLFDSKRRRRDLNPRAAINDLHPFQGCPFGQLGYFSRYFLYKITSLRDALFILLKTVLFVNLFFNFYSISDANFLIDVSYRLFPSWSITTMAGKFSTYNFRIASAPRSS